MSMSELLTVALIVFVGMIDTAALYVGLLGLLGGLYFLRCASCDHLAFSFTDGPRDSCPYCRHPLLLHPLHTVHHLRQTAMRMRQHALGLRSERFDQTLPHFPCHNSAASALLRERQPQEKREAM